MITNECIHQRLKELFTNTHEWVDPYDSEVINNKYLRKFVKVLLYFIPKPLYKLKLAKKHIWPENYCLMGKAFLMLGDIKNAEKVFGELEGISEKKYYWGLPINWKSAKYVFPKGLMMSTTTSEVALFLLELRKYSEKVTDEILRKIADNLSSNLNVVYEDKEKLIYGYTPIDEYRINNSNFLVASVIYKIGKVLNEQHFVSIATKIVNACLEGVSEDGGIPYYMNGNRYDSYHQVFSLRALYILKELSPKYDMFYNEAILFLKNHLMDLDGNVYLSPQKTVIDMQGSAEALYFFKMIDDCTTAKKIQAQIDKILKHRGRYIQRDWQKFLFGPTKSRILFTRQGELRLLLALINQNE